MRCRVRNSYRVCSMCRALFCRDSNGKIYARRRGPSKAIIIRFETFGPCGDIFLCLCQPLTRQLQTIHTKIHLHKQAHTHNILFPPPHKETDLTSRKKSPIHYRRYTAKSFEYNSDSFLLCVCEGLNVLSLCGCVCVCRCMRLDL